MQKLGKILIVLFLIQSTIEICTSLRPECANRSALPDDANMSDTSYCYAPDVVESINQTHESSLMMHSKLSETKEENETLRERINRIESFNLHQFIVDFVINNFRTNEGLNLSRECFTELSNLRADLIQSYHDSLLNFPNYWSQKGVLLREKSNL